MAFTLDPAVAKGLEPMAAAMAAAVPLAPEHPYPTPVEDCSSILRHFELHPVQVRRPSLARHPN